MVELLVFFFFNVNFPLERMCYFALPPTICECPFPHPNKRQQLKDFYRNPSGPFMFCSQEQASFCRCPLLPAPPTSPMPLICWWHSSHPPPTLLIGWWQFCFSSSTFTSFLKKGWVILVRQRHYKVNKKNKVNRFEVRTYSNSSISEYLEHGQFAQLWLEVIVPLPCISCRVILRVKWKYIFFLKVHLNILCLVANFYHIIKLSEHMSILIF